MRLSAWELSYGAHRANEAVFLQQIPVQLGGVLHLELLGHERMDRAVAIAVGGSDEAPTPTPVQVVLPHQPPNLFAVDDEVAVTELGIDAVIAIALEVVGDGTDLRDDLLVAGFALELGIKAGSRDAHQLASPPDGEAAGPPITDVGALRRECPERMPPFKNSISSACRPTSHSSAAIRAS
jgi:hypothetical protein